MESWTEKVVLITGAASGIGEGVVRTVLERGAKHVAVLDIAEEAGKALEIELNSKYGSNKVKFYKCDVSDEELFHGVFKDVFDEQGYIDVVINNAGIMNDATRSYKKQIDINFTAVVTGTLKGIEIMGKQNGGKGGAVINISSAAALCQLHILPIYFGTKSAVMQFSNCIGLEEHYGRTGVRILCVCFGPTDTAMLASARLGTVAENVDAQSNAETLDNYSIQTVESAAAGLADVFENGKSGDTWMVTSNIPAKNISDTVHQAYELLSQHVH